MVMNACDEKLVRGVNNSKSQMACLPSLSSGESEISPHFQHAMERSSDSDEGSFKSTSDDDSGCPPSSNASLSQTTVSGSKSSISSSETTSKSNGPQKRSILLENDNCEVATNKRRKLTNGQACKPVISSTAHKMMEKMGFKKGGGLGKHGQGRTAPVEASKQKGRRGLGVVIAEVDRDLIHYDPSKEVKEVYEEVNWVSSVERIELNRTQLLETWLKVGQKKRILDDETHFCEPDVLKRVLICKSAFDKMTGEEMRRARSRSNPYELIKKGPYMNRAAMKMANMDNVFRNIFTNPVDQYGNPMVGPEDLLYFADVCAGPGGFSEYILSKKKWRARGFGFTLKGDCDFKLSDFYAGPSESFEPCYGPHQDGDIYKPTNISSFCTHVHEYTKATGGGVHVMMADGGFSVEGHENIQEIMSKRLYLCQFAVALAIVRTGGHFVCKLFDVFTPFSVGLIYLMYRCFKQISIHKPNTSRPANSERYIICQWKLDNVDNVRDYLLDLNLEFEKRGEASNEEVNEVVPLDVMKNDQSFYDYLVQSNNSLAERQINSLAKILEYSEDETLVEETQHQLKKDCMEAWGVEIKARSGPSIADPEALVRNLLKNDLACLNSKTADIGSISDVEDAMKSIHDWHAVILGADSKEGTSATFFLGVGHKKTYKFDQSTKKWVLISDPFWDLQLSPLTLLFGEIVPERLGEGRLQMKRNVLHIIDAHYLGGEYIGHLHYSQRVRLCALYAHAIDRPALNKVMSVTVKQVLEIDELEDSSFCRMKNITLKTMAKELAVALPNSYYLPKGIMFLKATKSPYIRWISQREKLKYYAFPDPKFAPKFDRDRPREASNSFKETCAQSKTWFMNKEVDPNPLNAQRFVLELVHFIRTNKYTKNLA